MSIVYRRKEWRSMLRSFAESNIGSPFVWGSTDCAALARSALLVMFTEAIESVLPPAWTSIQEAASTLAGIGSFDALLRSLGAQIVSPHFARAGDIIIQAEAAEAVGGVSLMVCVDSTECLAVSHDNGVYFARLPKDGTIYSLWEIRSNG